MGREVYIIAEIQVKDYKTYFEKYALKFNEIIGDFGGEVLAGSAKADVIEGDRFGNWTVILKFPSKEHAFDCINSEAYAPLAKIRINEPHQRRERPSCACQGKLFGLKLTLVPFYSSSSKCQSHVIT